VTEAKENGGKTVSITTGNGAVILSCPVIRGQLAFKVLLPAILVSPCIASLVFSVAGGMTPGKVVGVACIAGAVALVGWLFVGSRERLILDGHGLAVVTKTALGVVHRRRRPLPILVQVEPLWEGTAEPLAQGEWTAAFIGHGGASYASVVLDGAGVEALRSALVQACLPRVAIIEIDTREHVPSSACVRCGYDLAGVPTPRCPECGTEATEAVMRAARRAHAERHERGVLKE